jgi:N-acetylglucosamine-6-phosphate deacetylase
VDLQVNGGAGVEVTSGSAALDRLERTLLARGVTSYLPTLVSGPDAEVTAAVAELDERSTDPASPVVGVHLEGPYLSPRHAGVHRPAQLRAPTDGPLPVAYASSCVRLVTLAPELPGSRELIAALHARGVTVSLGHADADAPTARAAFAAGASMVTHVFDAMRPLHHRAPGLVGAALIDPRVRVGIIVDGHHVDAIVLELVRRAAGRRVVLVSDASPAAAAPEGLYAIGGVDLVLGPDGVARTPGGVLAGSAILLDDAVRTWTRLTEATLAEAIMAASETPAAAIGLPPPLAVGSPADLVLMNDAGAVLRVMRGGAWVT